MCASNDLRNGFNATRRDKVLEAVLRQDAFKPFYPSIYRQYSRHGALYAGGKPITVTQETSDDDNTQYGSDDDTIENVTVQSGQHHPPHCRHSIAMRWQRGHVYYGGSGGGGGGGRRR